MNRHRLAWLFLIAVAACSASDPSSSNDTNGTLPAPTNETDAATPSTPEHDAAAPDAPPTDAGADAVDYGSLPTCAKGESTATNGVSMLPGANCKGCHSFFIAGTVFTAPHDSDDCLGADPSAASVVVTDSKGATHTLALAPGGNFSTDTVFSAPFNVKVVSGGKERAMSMALDSSMGACNKCHTAFGSGTPSPPGRIQTP